MIGPIPKSLLSKIIHRLLLDGISCEKFFTHKHYPGWEETLMFSLNCILKDSDSSDFKNLILQKQKSDVQSKQKRETGNEAMKDGCYEEALLCYTESIALASSASSGETLALAYANRGTLLKCMGCMEESIFDTGRALALNYPKHLQYKLFMRLAQCHQQLMDKEAALKNFSLAAVAMTTSKLSDADKEKLENTIKMDILILEQGMKTLKLEDSLDWKVSLAGIPNVSPAPPPHLTNGSNPTFPNISKNVSVCYNKTMGRHLVAAEDIKPGDVLIVEDLNCAMLLDKMRFTHCSQCVQRCRTLIPCSKCAWCMFCSDKCLADAAQKHELECSVLPVISENFDMFFCIATRLISIMGIEALKDLADHNKQVQPETPQDWINLGVDKDGKFSGINGSLSFKFTVKESYVNILNKCIYVFCISKFLNLNSLKCKLKVEALLLKILMSLKHTAYPLTEFQIRETQTMTLEIGKVLVASPSLLNHSCNPNVVQHHHKTTTVVRALQVIPKGSQLFVSYGRTYIKHPKSVRQNDLNELLGFMCNCEACDNNWPELKTLPPFPNFELPREYKASERILASLNQIKLKGMLSKKFILNKESLPLFLKHLILLDKFNQKQIQSYHDIVEDIRFYFAKQGNIYVHK